MTAADDHKRVVQLIEYLEEAGYAVDSQSISVGEHLSEHTYGTQGVRLTIGIPTKAQSDSDD